MKAKKRKFLLSLALMAMVGTLSFSACTDTPDGESTPNERLWTTERLYARAQELGYEGTLEDLLDVIRGESGVDGKDGVGIEEIEIKEGNLIISLTDGRIVDCGKVTGENGVDGVGISGVETDENGNLSLLLTDGRKIEVGNVKGEDGKGVSGVSINEKGELIFSFTDDTTKNLGVIKGTNGVDGVDGTNGKDGVGIANVDLDENGNLSVTLTSGTTLNLGNVKGQNGTNGKDGVGVAKTEINEQGELILTYTNGNSVNLGNVKGQNGTNGVDGTNGKDGVGIASVSFNAEGELIVTMTDGSSKNCGKPPVCSHTYSEWTLGKSPTCTSIGYNVRACEKCGNEEYDFIAETGHTWDSGKVILAPTCEETGIKLFACIVCATAKAEELAATGHSFPAEWTTVANATCTEEGEAERICSACGDRETRVIPAGHSYSSEWSYNETYHWHAATCEHTDEVAEKAVHNFNENNVCTVCNYVARFTSYEYFSFSLQIDDTYAISAKDESRLPAEIILPSVYNGKVITNISSSAFYDCDSLTSIIIPDSITSIDWRAFYDCNSLTSATIGNGVTHILDYAFQICHSLTSVTIGSSVRNIGLLAFSGCNRLIEVKNLSTLDIKAGSRDYGDVAYRAKRVYTEGESYLSTDKDGYIIYDDGTDKILVAYTGKETDLSLPSDITKINQFALWRCSSITSVNIPDSVTSIGEYAFSDCYKLIEVKNLSTLDIKAGSYNYGNAGYYAKRVYKEGESYLSTDKDGYLIYDDGTDKILVAYTGTETDLLLPSNITQINHGAFYNCNSLTSVEIPDGVTSIGYAAFYGCSSLTSVNIPDNVTSIGNSAFYNCSSLTSVNIPDGVTSIGRYAFSNTAHYNDTNNWENGVLYIGKHLIQAKRTLSGAYTIKDGTLTIANSAFEYCNLTSVEIPDSVTSIGGSAFYYCNSLTSVNIPDSVTSISGNAFAECSSLTSVYITDIEAWCKISFSGSSANPLYYAHNLYLNNELVTDLVIPDSVTSIGDHAFEGCSSLTSVEIPDSVTSIGDHAFEGCSSLTSVNIPDSVTSIGEWAFYNCSSLTSVTIGSGVTSIGNGAFYNCTNLTEIRYNAGECADLSWNNDVFSYAGQNGSGITVTIGANVKKIPAYLFYPHEYNSSYAPNVTNVVFEDGSVCECIGNSAFEDCKNLISIKIPDSVTSIGWSAFEDCKNLISIKIPDSLTSIGWSAFYNCRSLTSVTIGNSVTSIGEGAFRGCSSLTSVEIPDSVTGIGDYAFAYCRSLTSVTIGKGVTSIGRWVFSSCDSLTSVTFVDPNGWWVTQDSTTTSGTDIASSSLSDPATATTYLKSTYSYCDYYWKRS